MSETPSVTAHELPRARHVFFSPARIAAIASNTLLELIRLKVFYFMMIFALLLIGSSIFLVQFSFQEQFQVLKDISLGAMSIFTVLLAILATSMLLPKDVEDRTLYTILAKPVPRFEYLLGKLIGVLILLLISVALMSALFFVVLMYREQQVLAETMNSVPDQDLQAALAQVRASAFNPNLYAGIVLIFFKAAICAAVTLLVSTFASSWIFTVMVSSTIYVIGHIQSIARDYWLEKTDASALTKFFLGFVALFFPDFQPFSLVDDIAAGTAVPIAAFVQAVGLGSVYVAVYAFFAYLLFSGKEL